MGARDIGVDNACLRAAKWYSGSKGFAVLPCAENKRPKGALGLHHATSVSSEVDAFWNRWPDAQVAINCAASGLVVLDVDDSQSFAAHVKEKRLTVPKTPQAATPSEGRHYYFRAREGVRYAGRLCPGVDIKHNGYVLAPPSTAYSSRVAKSGGYEWIGVTSELAEAPAWMEAAIMTPKACEHTSRAVAEIEELLEHIDPDLPYSDWCSVLMGTHAATRGSDSGLNLAVAWSQRGEKFRPGEVPEKWKSFKCDGGHGVGTVAHFAKKHGAKLADISRRHSRDRTEWEIAHAAEDWFATLDLTDVEAWPLGVDLDHHPPLIVQPASESLPATDLAIDVVHRRANELVQRTFLASAAEPRLTSNYLIKGWLLRSTTALLFGPSGVGKSFVALSIAHAVASDSEWNGCKVRGGTVVYISAEGAGSFQNRVVALGSERNENLVVISAAIDLHTNSLDADALIALVKKNVGEKPVALVVVDTLARSFGGGDENMATDMGKVIGHIDSIREALDASILLVHHTGKDRDRGARGSSSLRAAVETEIEAKRGSGGDLSTLRSTKQRDMEASGELPYRLEVIPLGVDEDGDPVSSCRVDFVEDRAERGLTKRQRQSLDAVKACMASEGTDLICDLTSGDGETAVRRAVDREVAIEAIIVANESGDRNKDRRAARHQLDWLVKNGHLVQLENNVTLPD